MAPLDPKFIELIKEKERNDARIMELRAQLVGTEYRTHNMESNYFQKIKF